MYEDWEKLIKGYGFESLKEFNNMVAKVDISTNTKLKNFKMWQNNDGSKKGLQQVIEKNGVIERANKTN